MTPGTLLTMIGGTAIAFVMAIVAAASTVPGAATPGDETIAASVFAVQMPHDTTAERARMASWGEPCLIAL